MTDGQALLLVLVLLYLFDCIIWVGSRTVLFVSPWCRGWRTWFAGPHLGNREGSVTLGNPLPPLGGVFAAHWLPISFSPAGVCGFGFQRLGGVRRGRQAGNVLTYKQIKTVETEDKQVLLNGERFARCESAGQAQRLAALLGRVRQAKPAEREALLREFLAARFDLEPARKRLELAIDHVGATRWFCLVFFAYGYVLLPAACWLHGLAAHLVMGAIVIVCGAMLVSLQFFLAHRRLYPESKGERVGHVLKMVFCPPAAVRAHDQLSLRAMAEWHPLVLSHLLLGKRDVSLAGEMVRDLAHPMPYGLEDSQAREIVSWHAQAELEACGTFLREQADVVLDDLLAVPAWDGHATKYCPRCLAQLKTQAETCPDCYGVGLRPVPDVDEQEEPRGRQ